MSQQKSTTTTHDNDTDKRLPTDIKSLRSLVELMVDNDLSRLELREGETHILLRRGHPLNPAHTVPAASPVPIAQPAPVAAETTPTPDQPAESANETLIRSPMVGTFYTASDPESPPFVNVGSEINPESVVCLIEAMKVFNEIKAETSGRITRILIKNAEAVEFDQPLFAVAPA